MNKNVLQKAILIKFWQIKAQYPLLEINDFLFALHKTLKIQPDWERDLNLFFYFLFNLTYQKIISLTKIDQKNVDIAKIANYFLQNDV